MELAASKSSVSQCSHCNLRIAHPEYLQLLINQQRNCLDKSEIFYMNMSQVKSSLSLPYPMANIKIEKKSRYIFWLNEYNFGYGDGRVFFLKLGLYI